MNFTTRSLHSAASGRNPFDVLRPQPTPLTGNVFEDGTLLEVAALETVLASLQVDVACIQETKLQQKDKIHEIPQYREVCRDYQFSFEARGGGLIIYVHATLALSTIYPAAGASNVLENLAVAISLPEQRKILVSNWHLPSKTSNFLLMAGYSDSEFKT